MRTLLFCMLALSAGCKSTDSLPGPSVYDLSGGSSLFPDMTYVDLMPPAAVINGTIAGIAFHPTVAFSANVTGGSSSFGFILLSDKANFCQLLSQTPAAQPASANLMVIIVGNSDGSHTSTPTMTGTYTVATTSMMGNIVPQMNFSQTDTACMSMASTSEGAMTGSIQLTSVANGVYAGSMDVMMQMSGGGSMDHVTGEFHAQPCAGLATAFNTNPVCM
jgi:hypothetical protein